MFQFTDDLLSEINILKKTEVHLSNQSYKSSVFLVWHFWCCKRGREEVCRPAHLFFLNPVFVMMLYIGFEIQLYL